MAQINFPSGATAGTEYTQSGITYLFNGSSWTTKQCLSPGGVGSGDMLAAVYDANGNGVVDNAERLGGHVPGYYLERDYHVGVQPSSTISDFNSAVGAIVNQTLLDGVATGLQISAQEIAASVVFWLDSVNGLDTNSGNSAIAPLKTWDKLASIVGRGAYNQVVVNLAPGNYYASSYIAGLGALLIYGNSSPGTTKLIGRFRQRIDAITGATAWAGSTLTFIGINSCVIRDITFSFDMDDPESVPNDLKLALNTHIALGGTNPYAQYISFAEGQLTLENCHFDAIPGSGLAFTSVAPFSGIPSVFSMSGECLRLADCRFNLLSLSFNGNGTYNIHSTTMATILRSSGWIAGGWNLIGAPRFECMFYIGDHSLLTYNASWQSGVTLNWSGDFGSRSPTLTFPEPAAGVLTAIGQNTGDPAGITTLLNRTFWVDYTSFLSFPSENPNLDAGDSAGLPLAGSVPYDGSVYVPTISLGDIRTIWPNNNTNVTKVRLTCYPQIGISQSAGGATRVFGSNGQYVDARTNNTSAYAPNGVFV